MKKTAFDFSKIHTLDDFYQAFGQQFPLPDYFGFNLDALWDVITDNIIPLPHKIIFLNFQVNPVFESLDKLFIQAEKRHNPRLRYIKKPSKT